MWWRRLRYISLLVALCAIATCPAAKRACTANARAQEAEDLVTYLVERISRAHASTGTLPATAAGPTPTPSCCEQGGTCTPDAAVWSAAGWRELGFSIDAPYRYTYQYLPDPSGASAIVRAIGDLDCDGRQSLYEVKLTVVAGKLARAWTRKDPTE